MSFTAISLQARMSPARGRLQLKSSGRLQLKSNGRLQLKSNGRLQLKSNGRLQFEFRGVRGPGGERRTQCSDRHGLFGFC